MAVQDKIKVTLAPGHPLVEAAIQQHKDYICHETQALAMHIVEEIDDGTTFDMDGYIVKVQVTPY
jgi:isoleucyl-tRNA synthetase